MWKDFGEDQEEILPHKASLGGTKTEVRLEERIEERERLALRNEVKEEKHLRGIRGAEGRYWNENVFSRPNGLREKD